MNSRRSQNRRKKEKIVIFLHNLIVCLMLFGVVNYLRSFLEAFYEIQ